MLKSTSILIALLCFSFAANAQLYNKGIITLKNGKTVEGYVQIDYRFPQRFQNGISYMTPKTYAKFEKSGKVKGKDLEKLEPKHIQGFELESGARYATVKYLDVFSNTKTGVIPRARIFEQVADGKIKMYKFYTPTTGKKVSYELLDQKALGDAQLIEYIQNNFQLLVEKEGKDNNPKNVVSINLLNYIGDNDEVKTNYDNNHYGLRNQFSTEKKEGKLVNKEYETAFLKMLADYNK